MFLLHLFYMFCFLAVLQHAPLGASNQSYLEPGQRSVGQKRPLEESEAEAAKKPRSESPSRLSLEAQQLKESMRQWMQTLPSGKQETWEQAMLVWRVANLDTAPLPAYFWHLVPETFERLKAAKDTELVSTFYQITKYNYDLLIRLRPFFSALVAHAKEFVRDEQEGLEKYLAVLDQSMRECRTALTELSNILSDNNIDYRALNGANPYIKSMNYGRLLRTGLLQVLKKQPFLNTKIPALREFVLRDMKAKTALTLMHQQCDAVESTPETTEANQLLENIEALKETLAKFGYSVNVKTKSKEKCVSDYMVNKLTFTIDDSDKPLADFYGVRGLNFDKLIIAFDATPRASSAVAPSQAEQGGMETSGAQAAVSGPSRPRLFASWNPRQSHSRVLQPRRTTTVRAGAVAQRNTRNLAKKVRQKKKPAEYLPAIAALYPSVKKGLLEGKKTVAEAKGVVENEELFSYVVDLTKDLKAWKGFTEADFHLAYLLLNKNITILEKFRNNFSELLKELKGTTAWSGMHSALNSILIPTLSGYQTLRASLQATFGEKIAKFKDVQALPHPQLIMMDPQLRALLESQATGIKKQSAWLGALELSKEQFQAYPPKLKELVLKEQQARLGLLKIRREVLKQLSDPDVLNKETEKTVKDVDAEIKKVETRLAQWLQINNAPNQGMGDPAAQLSPYFREVAVQVGKNVLSIINGRVATVSPLLNWPPQGADTQDKGREQENLEFSWEVNRGRTSSSPSRQDVRRRQLNALQKKAAQHEKKHLNELQTKFPQESFNAEGVRSSFNPKEERLEDAILPSRLLASLYLKPALAMRTSELVLLYQILLKNREIQAPGHAQRLQNNLLPVSCETEALYKAREEIARELERRGMDLAKLSDVSNVVEPRVFALNIPLLSQTGKPYFSRMNLPKPDAEKHVREDFVRDVSVSLDWEQIGAQALEYVYLHAKTHIAGVSAALQSAYKKMAGWRAKLTFMGFGDTAHSAERPYNFRGNFEVPIGPYVLPFQDGKLLTDKVKKVALRQQIVPAPKDEALSKRLQELNLPAGAYEDKGADAYVITFTSEVCFRETLSDEDLGLLYAITLRNQTILKKCLAEVDAEPVPQEKVSIVQRQRLSFKSALSTTNAFIPQLRHSLVKRQQAAEQENNPERAASLASLKEIAESTSANPLLNAAVMMDVAACSRLGLQTRRIEMRALRSEVDMMQWRHLKKSIRLDLLLLTAKMLKIWDLEGSMGDLEGRIKNTSSSINRLRTHLRNTGMTDVEAQMAQRPYTFRNAEFQIPGAIITFKNGEVANINKGDHIKGYDVRLNAQVPAIAPAAPPENQAEGELSAEERELLAMINETAVSGANTQDANQELPQNSGAGGYLEIFEGGGDQNAQAVPPVELTQPQEDPPIKEGKQEI